MIIESFNFNQTIEDYNNYINTATFIFKIGSQDMEVFEELYYQNDLNGIVSAMCESLVSNLNTNDKNKLILKTIKGMSVDELKNVIYNIERFGFKELT